MDMQAIDFMNKEMMTTDSYTESLISNMFVRNAQAGIEVANAGRQMNSLQGRYGLLPYDDYGYPQAQLDSNLVSINLLNTERRNQNGS